MSQGEQLPQWPERDTVILTFVSEYAEWRREKRIVTKLIHKNFRADDGQRHDVAEPGRFGSIKKIDKRAIKTRDWNGKKQIAKVPRLWPSALKEKNQKNLRNDRAGRDRSDDHKG